MRKLAIAIAIILVLGVIAVLILPSVIDVNSYHDRIQAEMQTKLGRPVTLGRLHLSILPLYFSAESPVIGEDPGFRTGKAFAEANEVDVSAALWSLLHGDVQISSLELKQPKIELVRNPQGAWNFSSLGSNAPAGQPLAGNGANQAFSLQDMKITDGTVALTDYQKRQPRAIYDHIDLRLMGYAPGHAFDLIAAAHLPGQGAQLIKLQGTAGPINSAQGINTPFDGSLELSEVSLSGLQKFLNSSSLENTDAVISGKANLKNQAGKIRRESSTPMVHSNLISRASTDMTWATQSRLITRFLTT